MVQFANGTVRLSVISCHSGKRDCAIGVPCTCPRRLQGVHLEVNAGCVELPLKQQLHHVCLVERLIEAVAPEALLQRDGQYELPCSKASFEEAVRASDGCLSLVAQVS